MAEKIKRRDGISAIAEVFQAQAPALSKREARALAHDFLIKEVVPALASPEFDLAVIEHIPATMEIDFGAIDKPIRTPKGWEVGYKSTEQSILGRVLVHNDEVRYNLREQGTELEEDLTWVQHNTTEVYNDVKRIDIALRNPRHMAQILKVLND